MRWDFISVSWTPGVGKQDARLFVQELHNIYEHLRPHLGAPGQFNPLPTLRVFGAWRISGLPDEAPYRSIDHYIHNSMNASGSLVASRYLEMVQLEPWQTSHPHFDLVMTDRALVDDVTHYTEQALGFCQPHKIAMLSTHPFHGGAERRHALRRMVCHYFGELFNIPARTREHAVENGDAHLVCTNLCAMRHADTAEEAITLALSEVDVMYCEHCTRDLIAQITSTHYGTN